MGVVILDSTELPVTQDSWEVKYKKTQVVNVPSVFKVAPFLFPYLDDFNSDAYKTDKRGTRYVGCPSEVVLPTEWLTIQKHCWDEDHGYHDGNQTEIYNVSLANFAEFVVDDSLDIGGA